MFPCSHRHNVTSSSFSPPPSSPQHQRSSPQQRLIKLHQHSLFPLLQSTSPSSAPIILSQQKISFPWPCLRHLRSRRRAKLHKRFATSRRYFCLLDRRLLVEMFRRCGLCAGRPSHEQSGTSTAAISRPTPSEDSDNPDSTVGNTNKPTLASTLDKRNKTIPS